MDNENHWRAIILRPHFAEHCGGRVEKISNNPRRDVNELSEAGIFICRSRFARALQFLDVVGPSIPSNVIADPMAALFDLRSFPDRILDPSNRFFLFDVFWEKVLR